MKILQLKIGDEVDFEINDKTVRLVPIRAKKGCVGKREAVGGEYYPVIAMILRNLRV